MVPFIYPFSSSFFSFSNIPNKKKEPNNQSKNIYPAENLLQNLLGSFGKVTMLRTGEIKKSEILIQAHHT
jgi:hypothetical protein